MAKNTQQPEPVNQQLLAALKRLLNKAYKQNWQDNYPSEVECAEAAIAAAEAAPKPAAVPEDVTDLLKDLAKYAPSGLCAPTALHGFAIRASTLLSAAPKPLVQGDTLPFTPVK